MKQNVFRQTPRNIPGFDTMKQAVFHQTLRNIETWELFHQTPVKLIMFRHNETMKLSIVGTFWFGVRWLLTINNLDKRIVSPYCFDSMVSPV